VLSAQKERQLSSLEMTLLLRLVTQTVTVPTPAEAVPALSTICPSAADKLPATCRLQVVATTTLKVTSSVYTQAKQSCRLPRVQLTCGFHRSAELNQQSAIVAAEALKSGMVDTEKRQFSMPLLMH